MPNEVSLKLWCREVSGFKSAETLDVFRNHPEYVKVREVFQKIFDWIAVD